MIFYNIPTLPVVSGFFSYEKRLAHNIVIFESKFDTTAPKY